ncbi:uncharacterized protein N7511_007680 [Penicillium nucicola]|uniref:uncharacterized protein n=1 Tax=Penicillium nucicola TaxID=1850975 RepID=UPI002545996A|nr:uncharacterized protein N7511_007680 [Penicillium nucicola]KAJ5753527.1 hypothetical protein N7511_007680 [Penicillium nucicola]
MSFLDLDCAYDKDSEWQRSPCVIKHDVQAYCKELNWKPSSFFKTIWAIVLNKYTTSQAVTFAVHSNEIHKEAPTICDVSVEPQTSIVDILADCSLGTTFTETVQSQIPCNTGVVFDMQGDEIFKPIPPVQVLLLVSTTSSELWLSYSSNIASSHADNLVSTVEQTIEEVLRHPNQTVKELQLFSERNTLQVLEWNRHTLSSETVSMVDLIRKHASQRATHEAVCAWDGSLTYAELDSLTTRLAYHLRTMGIVENDKVLLGFEKSMYAVVAFLSILKAGAIFVPVSPSYPTERMQAIIDATHPRLAITLCDTTSVFEKLQVPALGLNQSVISGFSVEDHDPLPASSPQRVAYILFTSGSTGLPKGCVISNQALGTMTSQGPPFQIYPSSRVLQVAPIIFAASSVDMFLPLLTGGTVCIASKHDLMNNLAASMKQFRITWACMTPSAIASVDPSELSGLQTLGLVGEPVSEDLLNKWASSVDLLSGYGLSEIVGAGCISSLQVGMHPRNIGVSPTAHIWLADPTNINRLSPVGAIGEVLIDGPNLANGYLDDPQKTANTFIQGPRWLQDFYPGPNRYVLRTGDLARYHSDGSIVYVGRKDTQIKIRGKRVELGEVESVIRLRQAPDDAVIVEAAAPFDGDSTPMLIGFIHTSGGQLADSSLLLGSPSQEFRQNTSRLDQLVRAVLPEYMIPSIYIPLNRIPKTASGKTDRRALRLEVSGMTRQQIELYHNSGVKPQVRPQTDAEKSVHKLFCQILRRDEASFGVHDHFLRLGGDSIKAISLVQLCRKVGLAVNVADIMESGTVAQLAQMANRSPQSTLENGIWRFEVPTTAVKEQLTDLGVAAQEVEAMNPCSSMQDGILMSQLKSPQQYALRVLYEVQLSEKLSTSSSKADLGRLQKAWQSVVQIHPMLRTIFVTNVTPSVFAVQVQLKNGSIPRIHEVDDNLQPSNIFDQRQDCQPPSTLPQFDLYVTPSGRIILELELSHAVVDGMSMSMIVRDLCRFYDNPSPSLSVFDFADYVQYQQNVLTDDSLVYWKQYLDCMEPTQFPTASDGTSDLSKSSSQTSQFKALSVDVGSVAEYRKFAQQTGTTVANVVKLAWSLVLQTMCRTDDVCFGFLATSRDAPVEGILEGVGPLINLIVFRQQLDNQSTVEQVLQSIQADFISSLPHKGSSLSDIRRTLDFSSDEVMFNTCISHFPATADDGADELPILLHEVGRQDPTEFDLSLEIMESEDEIEATIKAYTGRVPLEQMERVAALFGHLMKTIPQSSGRLIGELELVPPEQLATIRQLNRGINNLPIDACVHDIILRQCQSQPRSPAICAWDGDWTYGELDYVSSCLAEEIQSQGVTLESFVPVLMDKSRWVPIALLAILRAGGAFVLLDPTQPVQRLKDICIDLNPTTILVSPEYQATAIPLVNTVVVVNNEHSRILETDLGETHKVAAHPGNAAYAVFTSGSTGKPKGVAITHRSLCTSAAAMMEHLPMTSTTRMLQYASHAFDVSVLDLTVCLMAGGCLCIPSAGDRQNRLTESLNDFSVSLVALTPTVTRTIQPERLTTLKTLKVSGEALSSFDIQRWKTAAPHIQIVNMYGPAECTINSTVQGPVELESYPSNIGYPLRSATTWVVNSKNHHKLLPMGAVGELVIQGPVVGRGYLNRAEQTAASFIAPPDWLRQFMPAVSDDERLYKTGDLVQYAADGSMHYKGRKDFQVKLRGQRLELGEVEAQLRRVFPNASDAIAEVAYLNQGKTSALVAFIHQAAWDSDSSSDPATELGVESTNLDLLHAPCKAFDQAVAHAKVLMAATLPSYMEPSIYLPLIHVPRSRSGKADRGRLQQIVISGLHERWTGGASTVPMSQRRPITEMEVTLCSAVAGALGLSEADVSAEDSFFRRGGDSVAAMMLVGSLREQGCHLTVADIFANPKLDILATKISRVLPSSVVKVPLPFSLLGDNEDSNKAIIAQAMTQCDVAQKEIEDIYPCSPLQHAFFMFSSTREKGTLIARFAYDLWPETDLGRLQKAWYETTKAHPMLRTRIIQVEGKSNLHQAVLGHATEIEYHDSDELDYVPDLPIEVGPGKPLLRIAVLRRSSAQHHHRLVITLQHSLYDGWSRALLMQELERAYSGVALQPLPVSPFIGHLDQTNEGALQFWTSELRDLQSTIFPQVPSAYTPHPSATLVQHVKIPKLVSPQITLSTKIRWAWAHAISLQTSNSEVAMGLGTAGRGTPVAGIERLVAPTMAIFPYRIHISPKQKVIDALQESQAHYSQILPHEHYGTPNICRAATGPTSPAALQTLLIVQPQGEQNPSSLYFEEEMLPQTGAFHVRALTLHCHLQESSVETVACYDDKLISENKMLEVLSMFDLIFQQVCQEPSIPVRELRAYSAED